MVGAATAPLTALDGGPKAFTVCTALVRKKNKRLREVTMFIAIRRREERGIGGPPKF